MSNYRISQKTPFAILHHALKHSPYPQSINAIGACAWDNITPVWSKLAHQVYRHVSRQHHLRLITHMSQLNAFTHGFGILTIIDFNGRRQNMRVPVHQFTFIHSRWTHAATCRVKLISRDARLQRECALFKSSAMHVDCMHGWFLYNYCQKQTICDDDGAMTSSLPFCLYTQNATRRCAVCSLHRRIERTTMKKKNVSVCILQYYIKYSSSVMCNLIRGVRVVV